MVEVRQLALLTGLLPLLSSIGKRSHWPATKGCNRSMGIEVEASKLDSTQFRSGDPGEQVVVWSSHTTAVHNWNQQNQSM